MLESARSLFQKIAIWSKFAFHIDWAFGYGLWLLIDVMIERTLSLLILFTSWPISTGNVFSINLASLSFSGEGANLRLLSFNE